MNITSESRSLSAIEATIRQRNDCWARLDRTTHGTDLHRYLSQRIGRLNADIDEAIVRHNDKFRSLN